MPKRRARTAPREDDPAFVLGIGRSSSDSEIDSLVRRIRNSGPAIMIVRVCVSGLVLARHAHQPMNQTGVLFRIDGAASARYL